MRYILALLVLWQLLAWFEEPLVAAPPGAMTSFGVSTVQPVPGFRAPTATPGADAMSALGTNQYGYGYGAYSALSRRDVAYVRFLARQQRIEAESAAWHARDLTPRWGGVGGIPRWYNGR